MKTFSLKDDGIILQMKVINKKKKEHSFIWVLIATFSVANLIFLLTVLWQRHFKLINFLNGATVTAVLLLAFSGLFFVANKNGFTTFTYGVKRFFQMVFLGKSKLPSSLYEYNLMRKRIPRQIIFALLINGGMYVILSLILYIIYATRPTNNLFFLGF